MTEQEKSLYMTVLMTPDMANFAGNVHGGALLKLLDQVAYACAARYCKSYVVTLLLDQVTFKETIRVGELVSFLANVNYVGKTSMEVGVKVIAEDLRTKTKRHTNSCYFTMVAIGDDGKPMPAPTLEISSASERKLYDAALMRREMRREIARRNEAITSDTPESDTHTL